MALRTCEETLELSYQERLCQESVRPEVGTVGAYRLVADDFEELESRTGTGFVIAEQLVAEHYDAIYRYAYRLTGEANAAEDVAQEVFVRALKGCQQLRDPQAARGWLYVIARNEFSRWLSKFASTAPLVEAECERGEAACADLERGDWVQRSLMRLPPDFRVVVTMFYFEQLSYSEIARELDVPIGTVMSRLNRARKHLKDVLTATAEPNFDSPAHSVLDCNRDDEARVGD